MPYVILKQQFIRKTRLTAKRSQFGTCHCHVLAEWGPWRRRRPPTRTPDPFPPVTSVRFGLDKRSKSLGDRPQVLRIFAKRLEFIVGYIAGGVAACPRPVQMCHYVAHVYSSGALVFRAPYLAPWHWRDWFS